MPYADAITFGLLCAYLLAQAVCPPLLLMSGQEPQPEPAPPADDPRRSPDWCHSHDKHRKDEEH